MNMIKIIGLGLWIFILLMSCSSDTPFEADNNPPPDNDLSTFTKIQSEIFTPTCALSGCHTGSNPQANLNLSAGEAYNALVDINSVQIPSRKRVAPGNSADSYLIDKLKGTNMATNTSQMPFGGIPLSDATIDSIAKWIDSGAPNN